MKDDDEFKGYDDSEPSDWRPIKRAADRIDDVWPMLEFIVLWRKVFSHWRTYVAAVMILVFLRADGVSKAFGTILDAVSGVVK